MKKLLALAILTLTFKTYAFDYAGEYIIDLPCGHARGLVVMAPAKRYLMRERLFTELAQKLNQQGYATVRFNWNADTLSQPELEITRAQANIQTVIQAAQKELGISAKKTVLISKSFSTKALEPSLNLAAAHILLTPNCSAEAPFSSMYQNVLAQGNVSIFISNNDPYCEVGQIYQHLATHRGSTKLFTTDGDHNFVTELVVETGYRLQDEVVESVARRIATIL